MATQFSITAIKNAALVSQGLDEINDEQDLPEHRVLHRNWPLIVESELEDGLYFFTKKQATLSSRVGGLYGYDDGYAIPGDALHVRHLWIENEDGVRLEPAWTQDDQHVYLDSTTGCTIEYIHVADPSFWTANFSRGVQMKLEAALLRAVKEEAGEAATMEQMAEAQFQRARTQSSKSRSAKPLMRRSTFADARFGRWMTNGTD